MGKGKGTFAAAKLLEDSCKSNHMKIQSSRSKFGQCSSVCVGKQGL